MKSLLKLFVSIFLLVIVGVQVSQAQNSQYKAALPAYSTANEAKPEVTAPNPGAKSLATQPTTRDRVAFNAMTVPSSNANSSGLQFGDENGWEIFLAGGGSFWTSQERALSVNDVITVTPDPGLSNIPVLNKRYRIRQSFAPGGRVAAGVVKNFNERSAVEVSYLYGTNNFRLTALEDIGIAGLGYGYGYEGSSGYGYSGNVLAPAGYTRSLGMRSHIAAINYRHSFVNNEQARWYLTGGFNVTVFQPNNDGLDQLFGLGPSDASLFTVRPHFKTVAAPGVNFGGGVIVKATDTVGFRFDVRDYLSFTKRVRGTTTLSSGEKIELNLFGDTVHNLVPTIGVVFTPR